MTQHEDLPSRIERLESLEEIRNLRSRYMVYADRVIATPNEENAVAMADLFTDDAFADYGFLGKFEGRAALLNAFGTVIPGIARWSMHFAANPILSVKGDEGEGTWYFLVRGVMRQPPGSGEILMTGTYEEKYRRVDGVWKFSRVIAHFSDPPKD